MPTTVRPTSRPQSHLINILRATRGHHPNFSLFLGAGASVQSGVKSANEMIGEWRESFCKSLGLTDASEKQTVLARQPWFNATDEYSALFEALFDQPSLRREFVEACIESACPSWGYIYLARLIEKRVFNTIFTTNFDDLINEACYLFTANVRPIVCAHDSSIRSIRITSRRPKIIKLHGDFLFDNIKNTLRELESLESNMRDKFRQYAGEFGMVFIGYSGRDRSIMDTLDALLRTDSNFPHGIYWCIRHASHIPESVESLRRFPKFHLIEIRGFDSFMADLHEGLSLGESEVFADPYQPLTLRLNNLIDRLPIPGYKTEQMSSALENDVLRLGETLKTLGETKDGLRFRIPFRLLSYICWRRKDARAALDNCKAYLEQLDKGAADLQCKDHFDRFVLPFKILRLEYDEDVYQLALQGVRDGLSIYSLDPWLSFDTLVDLVLLNKFDDARTVLESVKDALPSDTRFRNYYAINDAQLYCHQKLALPGELAKELEDMSRKCADPLVRYGASCALQRDGEAHAAWLMLRDGENKLPKPLRDIAEFPVTLLLSPETRNLIYKDVGIG